MQSFNNFLIESSEYEKALDYATQDYLNAKTIAEKKKIVNRFAKEVGSSIDHAESTIKDTVWDREQND